MSKVEEVARAIAKTQGFDLPHDMTLPYAAGSRVGKAMAAARAAIEAMREPTRNILTAFVDADTSIEDARVRWEAAIDAALNEEGG